MVKSLLILMLMTMQLLAGSGGSVYLCISNDGEYCCLDTGPQSCTCCQEHQQEAAHETCCSEVGCSGKIAGPPCGQRNESSSLSGEMVMDGACGCTHVPIAASADHPTTVIRPTVTVESERLALLVAWLPTRLGDTDAAAFLPHFRWTGPPAVPDFTLTVISTVVIRC